MSFRTVLKAGFFSSAQTGLETALLAGRPHRGMECRQRLWIIDVGQLVGRCLKDCPVVVDLHELSPVGRWATGGRDGRWFERFAEVCHDFPDRARIGDECDEAVCRMSRSRGRWHLRPPHVRRPHAHQSRHHAEPYRRLTEKPDHVPQWCSKHWLKAGERKGGGRRRKAS